MYLSDTFARLVKVNVFPVFAVHAHSLLGRISITIFLELELSHAVKQLGQVTCHL
jgi:hypothetical protein